MLEFPGFEDLAAAEIRDAILNAKILTFCNLDLIPKNIPQRLILKN